MKIREQQSEIIAKAQTPSGLFYDEAPTNTILTATLNYSEFDLYAALGQLGATLKKFASECHLLHPGLRTLFSGQLVSKEKESFSTVAQEVLKLSRHIDDQHYSQYVGNRMKDIIKKHPFYNKIKNSLDAPSSTYNFCRFVHDPVIRNKLRNSYTLKQVNLTPLYKKGKEYWDNLPSDFSLFARHNCEFDEDIAVIETRYAHFKKLGLHSMASEIAKSADKLRDAKDESTYLGFNRMSLHRVSGIVAKSLNCVFNENSICPPPEGDLMTSTRQLATAVSVYNIEKHKPPKEISQLVAHLDHSPELQGWPAFDRFVVLRIINDFVGYLKDADLPRILLGEVDKKMFYIAHWYI